MTREQILQKLLDERVIKEGDARDIRSILPDNADEAAVLAIIKGQFPGVKPRDAVNAIGSSMGVWSDAPSWTFSDFTDKEEGDELVRRILEKSKGTSGEELQQRREERLAQEERDKEWYLDKGYESRGDVSDQMRQEYERLKAAGVFSTEDMAAIEPFIHKYLDSMLGTTEGKIQEFVTLLASHGVTSEELGSTMLEFRTTDPSMDEQEAGFIGGRQPGFRGVLPLGEDGEEIMVEGLRSLDPRQQAAAVGGDTMVNSMDQSEMSFVQSMYADGTIPEGQTIKERDRLTYFEDDFVVDRATGVRMSRDEWNLIQTSEAARENYRATTQTSDVVQRLLDSGKFTRSRQYDTVYRLDESGRPQPHQVLTQAENRFGIPIEDLNIPTLAPTGAAWEGETYDYKVGDGRGEWMEFSPRERHMRLGVMASNGLLTDAQLEAMNYQDGTGGSVLNFTAMAIWEQALSVSSQFQMSGLDGLSVMGEAKAVAEAGQRGGSGARGPTYSVPASLREIPDYKTLAQNTKSIFRGQLGREMEDWEVNLYADELGRQHETTNEQRIQIHKEAWDDAVAGGSTDVDFTSVEDPNAALDYDIEEAYANEIDRNVRVEDKANQHRLLMGSIAAGRRMI